MKESVAAAEPDVLEELLLSTGAGDRQAFARLYQLTAGRLLAIVMRLVGSRAVAEEILQETYLTVWRKASKFSPKRGSPLTWMMIIARNKAIDRLRADGTRARVIESFDADTALDVKQIAERCDFPQHLSGTVRQCVEGLQHNHRKAILLAYYYGFSHDELADALDSPLGTVKSWIRRGLLQLRECVDQ